MPTLLNHANLSRFRHRSCINDSRVAPIPLVVTGFLLPVRSTYTGTGKEIGNENILCVSSGPTCTMELSGMRDELLCGMYQQTARAPVWSKEGFPLLPEVQCRGGETFSGKHDYPVLESAPEVLRLPFSSQAAPVNGRVGCCHGPIY